LALPFDRKRRRLSKIFEKIFTKNFYYFTILSDLLFQTVSKQPSEGIAEKFFIITSQQAARTFPLFKDWRAAATQNLGATCGTLLSIPKHCACISNHS